MEQSSKTRRKTCWKNIINNPTRAFQIASQLGAAAATKNSKAIMNAGMQAGKFSVSGRGAVKIGELTDGSGLYLKAR